MFLDQMQGEALKVLEETEQQNMHVTRVCVCVCVCVCERERERERERECEIWASQVVLVVKNLPAIAGDVRCRFDPWIEKIPWRRAWQPALVFLPGESYGQRSQRVSHDLACL